MASGGSRAPRPARANGAAPEQGQTAFAAEFERARRLCLAGEFVAAEALCRQMLVSAPARPHVRLMLGRILGSLGRDRDAVATLASLVEDHPDFGSAHFRLGNALHAAGRFAEAASHLRRAVELQPRLARGHGALGLALEALGDREGAIRAYECAVSLDPELAAVRVNLGIACLNAGRPEDAVFHLRRAVAVAPAANIDHFLGRALQKIGKDEESVPWYERALSRDPKLVAAWLGLGSAMRALGRFVEAARAFERVLAIDPGMSVARHALTTVRLEIGDTGELDRLRTLVANPDGGADDRAAAAMSMAKILDDCGRYDEAFAAVLEGKRIFRAGQAAVNIFYDHAAFCARNDELIRVFSPQFLANSRDWGARSESPVFIVGYFRTGSTLVEQICASHSQVHGIGESNEIPRIAAEVQRTAPSDWTAPMFKKLADPYVERSISLAAGKSRVVDKMLDNVFRLGLIATLFPRARVIFTHRDGRDAALSVMMRHFAREIAFATDLIDAGRRWRETERVAAHWSRCLPLATHHVQYETLVADFETEARKLIDFLGLRWEPACLEFYKTERAVSTASAWQVRQPLYDSSVGRWRHYAKHLTELCEVLGIDAEAPTGALPADSA